eukprot:TRINITY_DN73481_c0_g1_i1.p1 TRINITY_DN73481_c0_g1~~TRINITY_DN73481_c0_g1_i1.p1  ORF type:complete len:268 (+),score=69.67 TRINITY_DN73481_c0_g1_i1:46-849(+)
MRVLFIRHAQSANNVILEELRDRARAGELTHSEAEAEFHRTRSQDPVVTPDGYAECERLGDHYGPTLRETGAVIYISGMQRTAITATPLIKNLRSGGEHVPVCVHPELHEGGGVFVTDPVTKRHYVPDSVTTGGAIKERFGVDISMLPPPHLPWYSSATGLRETPAECVARAGRIVEWLRSEPLHESVGERTLVVVSHQAFLSMVFSALLNAPSVTALQFQLGNTETALASIPHPSQAAKFPQPIQFRWIGNGDHLGRDSPHNLSKL